MITGCRDIKRNIKKSAFVFYDTAPFDVSLNILASNDRKKMCHSSLESSHNGESNGGKIILPRSLDAEILSETSKNRHLYFTILRRLTFHLLSRHPVIVERCATARWNRLITASRMVVNPSFRDHWLPRY